MIIEYMWTPYPLCANSLNSDINCCHPSVIKASVMPFYPKIPFSSLITALCQSCGDCKGCINLLKWSTISRYCFLVYFNKSTPKLIQVPLSTFCESAWSLWFGLLHSADRLYSPSFCFQWPWWCLAKIQIPLLYHVCNWKEKTHISKI